MLNMSHRENPFLRNAGIPDPHITCTGVLMHLKLCTSCNQSVVCLAYLQLLWYQKSQAFSTPQELACITLK